MFLEDKKFIQLKTFNNFEKVNEDFLKCTISVMSHEQIANGCKFRKDGIERAIPTLDYAPVIGYWKDDDFNDHGIEYVMNNDGIEEVVRTVPFGVVIKGSERFENIVADNGETQEYLMADCYLWNRYEKAINKVKENRCNQSMEVNVVSADYTSDYYDIKDFNFSALCILGEDVDPAFSLAKIRTCANFSDNKFENEYKEMLDVFKRFSMEGGDVLENNKEIIDNFEENEEETEEMKKKRCEEEQENEEKEVEKCSEKEEKPKEEEMKKKKCENEEEVEKVNYSEIISSLRDEISELKENYSKLEEKYNSVNEELVSLREFKASKDLEERNAKEEEIFEQYNDDLCEVEEFAKLKENSKEYSLEELNEKCLLIWAKNERNNRKSSKKFNKEDKKEEMYVYDKKDSKNDLGAWSIL